MTNHADQAVVSCRTPAARLIDFKSSRFASALFVLLIPVSIAQVHRSPNKGAPSDVTWKSFTSCDGWTIDYPSDWKVFSCAQCPDPAAPHVPAIFLDPTTEQTLKIERLVDQPAKKEAKTSRSGDPSSHAWSTPPSEPRPRGSALENWLIQVSHDTVLNPRLGEEWLDLNGVPALSVRNQNPDSTQSENTYLTHGAKTFAIHASSLDQPHFVRLYRHALRTFRLSPWHRSATM